MTDPAEVESAPALGSDEGLETVVRPRWGLGDAVLALVTGLVLSTVTATVYMVVAGVDVTEQDTGLVIAGLVGLWTGFGGVAVRASRRKGTGSLTEDYGLRIEARDIPLGVVVGLVCQFVLVPIVVSLFGLLDDNVSVGEQAKEVTGDAGGLRLVVLAPFLCLGAPFFEELYFRGLLQRAGVRRLGTAGGVILSATAFGLVHLGPVDGWSAAALVVALALFGVVLSWLAHRTARLGPGLAAHTTFNAVTLVALALGWG